MGKTVFLLLLASVFLYSLSSVSAQSPAPEPNKTQAFIDSIYNPTDAENKTFRILAAYSENSTGFLKLIPNADCKITFADKPNLVQNMNFVADTGYESAKAFTESVKVSYTVACSHANFTQQTQTKQIDV